jgi:hypothetical protein
MKNDIKIGMLVALALSLLLIACDRELPNNKSGKEVTVRVRLVGIQEGGKEDLTRSASMKEPERISTSTSDGMLLEMQMERDTSALRATKTQLASDSYFRVIAFKHDTKTFISYGDFTIADGPVGGSLHVPINDSYDFVCYSYNTSTPLDALTYKQGETMPDTETISALQGTNDLLWVKIEKDVTDVAPELNIVLNRVMVRVKVAVDLSYNKWTISNIADDLTLESVGTGGTIQLADGAVASNTGTPTFSSWTGSGYKLESSTELLVMPNASGTTISIPKDAIVRQALTAIPTKATTATFTELQSGLSYKLLVRLRIPIFARSNIYWDDITAPSKPTLTFEPAADDPAQNDDTKAGYQGVFFKWGSLVGISPVGSFSGTTAIYVPIVKSTLNTSTWKATNGNSTGLDDDIDPSVRHNYTTWSSGGYNVYDETPKRGDIPYMDSSFGGTSSGRSNTWLIDANRNEYNVYKEFRGDICQYLSKTQTALEGYRLPSSYEFGINNTTWAENEEGWEKATPYASATGNEKGTAIITGTPAANNYGKNTKMDDVIFPVSGYRGSTGTQQYLGIVSYYWSGSANTEYYGLVLYLSGSEVGPGMAVSRSYGNPVRCVKKVDPAGSY